MICIKDKSCCYLKAVDTKEARVELLKRWGRVPKSQHEAQGCKCCKVKK